ncbi:hypothetical protein Tco_0472957, partial [Tanacetum coccineum]
MATLSTLELMLHEIQNKEKLEPYGDHGRMPTLPQRPVSKARMPSRRARRAVLSYHLQEISAKKKEEFVNGVSKRDKFAFVNSGLVLSKVMHNINFLFCYTHVDGDYRCGNGRNHTKN